MGALCPWLPFLPWLVSPSLPTPRTCDYRLNHWQLHSASGTTCCLFCKLQIRKRKFHTQCTQAHTSATYNPPRHIQWLNCPRRSPKTLRRLSPRPYDFRILAGPQQQLPSRGDALTRSEEMRMRRQLEVGEREDITRLKAAAVHRAKDGVIPAAAASDMCVPWQLG